MLLTVGLLSNSFVSSISHLHAKNINHTKCYGGNITHSCSEQLKNESFVFKRPKSFSNCIQHTFCVANSFMVCVCVGLQMVPFPNVSKKNRMLNCHNGKYGKSTLITLRRQAMRLTSGTLFISFEISVNTGKRFIFLFCYKLMIFA